jgi:hypothetical protein
MCLFVCLLVCLLVCLHVSLMLKFVELRIVGHVCLFAGLFCVVAGMRWNLVLTSCICVCVFRVLCVAPGI